MVLYLVLVWLVQIAMCNVNDDQEIDYERFVNEVAAAKENRAITDPTGAITDPTGAITDPTDPAEGPA